MKEREKLSIIFWYCSRKEVAVKSQYPDIADLVDADLTVLERIFTALANIAPGIQLQPVLDYLKGTLLLVGVLLGREHATNVIDVGSRLSKSLLNQRALLQHNLSY
jgi:hypothetical protein